MSLAVIHTRALVGLHAPEVVVEVHLANGLPSFTLVGLADTEVKEARERVRAALAQSGFSFPHNKKITVNLAPADLPKEFIYAPPQYIDRWRGRPRTEGPGGTPVRAFVKLFTSGAAPPGCFAGRECFVAPPLYSLRAHPSFPYYETTE